jgi:hypothetical protein
MMKEILHLFFKNSKLSVSGRGFCISASGALAVVVVGVIIIAALIWGGNLFFNN